MSYRSDMSLDLKQESGWYSSRHFLVKGARATVAICQLDRWGWSVGLLFDDDSWIDTWGKDKGKVVKTPPKDRGRYHFHASKVRKLSAVEAAEDQ